MVDVAERVISMGCGVAETCPTTLTLTEDWNLDDPHGEPIARVRRIRDEIRDRVAVLVAEMVEADQP
jgi:hypothetical protein